MTTPTGEESLPGASEHLIVFAREPIPGRVKTRLAADSSDAFALAVYRRLLTRSLRLAHSTVRLRQKQGMDCRLVIAGAWPEHAGAMRLTGAATQFGAVLTAQPNGDLGERMHAAFAASFAAGARRVVLMGCDCPGLRVRDLNNSLSALQTHEVVLGPTLDGGYCLIGLSGPAPQLFGNMCWSQADVMEQTMHRLGRRRLYRLPPQRDVDHLADWEHWCAVRAKRALQESLVWGGA